MIGQRETISDNKHWKEESQGLFLGEKSHRKLIISANLKIHGWALRNVEGRLLEHSSSKYSGWGVFVITDWDEKNGLGYFREEHLYAGPEKLLKCKQLWQAMLKSWALLVSQMVLVLIVAFIEHLLCASHYVHSTLCTSTHLELQQPLFEVGCTLATFFFSEKENETWVQVKQLIKSKARISTQIWLTLRALFKPFQVCGGYRNGFVKHGCRRAGKCLPLSTECWSSGRRPGFREHSERNICIMVKRKKESRLWKWLVVWDCAL